MAQQEAPLSRGLFPPVQGGWGQSAGVGEENAFGPLINALIVFIYFLFTSSFFNG